MTFPQWFEILNTVEKKKENWWRTILKMIPQVAVIGVLTFVFVIQDPCRCGLDNHYRFVWAGDSLEVEISPQARNLLNPALFTYELEREVLAYQGTRTLNINFSLMGEFDNGFETSPFFHLQYTGSENSARLASDTLTALDVYFENFN